MSDSRRAREPAFLIIKLAALGDIAVSSALLTRIRSTSPRARVTWLVGEAGAPLVSLFDVDEVVTVNERALLTGTMAERAAALAGVTARLLGRRFDRAFLVHADSRYRVLTWSLRQTPVSALQHGVNPVANRFRGDEYARLFDDATASRGPIVTRYPLADVRRRLPPPAPSGRTRRTVALVPGGTRNILREDVLRRWPLERYRQLAQRLLEIGYEVILVGDTNDAFVRPSFQGLLVTDRIGASTLVDALCILRDTDLVVSHDTGPLHFARLVRTPVVALFGPTDPRQMLGPDDDITALWGGDGLPCRPCYDGRNYADCADNLCMQDISVDRVMQAVQRRLAGAAGLPLHDDKETAFEL
jgi:heptosyltransferase II